MTPQKFNALEALAKTWLDQSAQRAKDSEFEPTVTTQQKMLYGAQRLLECSTELSACLDSVRGRPSSADLSTDAPSNPASALEALAKRWFDRFTQRLDDAEAEPTLAMRRRLEHGAWLTQDCGEELRALLDIGRQTP
ncbi:MAG: hypothetical protein RR101_14405 [Burkholderiaceae bacterium]